MNGPIGVRILASLREEIGAMVSDIARGNYRTLDEFTKMQGKLFGMEQALETCKRVVNEADDEE